MFTLKQAFRLYKQSNHIHNISSWQHKQKNIDLDWELPSIFQDCISCRFFWFCRGFLHLQAPLKKQRYHLHGDGHEDVGAINTSGARFVSSKIQKVNPPNEENTTLEKKTYIRNTYIGCGPLTVTVVNEGL